MKKKLLILLALFVCLFASCNDGSGSSDPVDPPVHGDPDFILTTQDKDAVDTFSVPGIGLNNWTNSPCPIVVLVKNATATGNHYKKSILNDYCAKNDGILVPATFFFSTDNAPAFKIQIECISEDQGRCCVKFSTVDITDAERNQCAGQWNIRVGKASEYHQDTDDYVDNVLYEACVEISSSSGSGMTVKTKEEMPEFALITQYSDPIDTFAVPGIGANNWTATPNCPIVILAKHPTATGGYYKKCILDGYWAKDNSKSRPATFHFNAPRYNNILNGFESDNFKIQVQCLSEEQGLCCIKFTKRYGGTAGLWEIKVGKYNEYNSMNSDENDSVDNVLYEANVLVGAGIQW